MRGMSWRFVLTLSLLALLSLTSGCERADEPATAKVLLFPTLAERQDQLERLQLRGAGNAVLVTLLKKDDGWRVAERGEWPADGGRVESANTCSCFRKRIAQSQRRPTRPCIRAWASNRSPLLALPVPNSSSADAVSPGFC